MAFNVWTVNFIRTPTTIYTQVLIAIAIVSSGQCVLWMAKTFTATHTPGETANHGHFTLLILSVCVSQKARICYPIKICMYITCKSCPTVGELASSPIEGKSSLHGGNSYRTIFSVRIPWSNHVQLLESYKLALLWRVYIMYNIWRKKLFCTMFELHKFRDVLVLLKLYF